MKSSGRPTYHCFEVEQTNGQPNELGLRLDYDKSINMLVVKDISKKSPVKSMLYPLDRIVMINKENLAGMKEKARKKFIKNLKKHKIIEFEVMRGPNYVDSFEEEHEMEENEMENGIGNGQDMNNFEESRNRNDEGIGPEPIQRHSIQNMLNNRESEQQEYIDQHYMNQVERSSDNATLSSYDSHNDNIEPFDPDSFPLHSPASKSNSPVSNSNQSPNSPNNLKNSEKSDSNSVSLPENIGITTPAVTRSHNINMESYNSKSKSKRESLRNGIKNIEKEKEKSSSKSTSMNDNGSIEMPSEMPVIVGPDFYPISHMNSQKKSVSTPQPLSRSSSNNLIRQSTIRSERTERSQRSTGELHQLKDTLNRQQTTIKKLQSVVEDLQHKQDLNTTNQSITNLNTSLNSTSLMNDNFMRETLEKQNNILLKLAEKVENISEQQQNNQQQQLVQSQNTQSQTLPRNDYYRSPNASTIGGTSRWTVPKPVQGPTQFMSERWGTHRQQLVMDPGSRIQEIDSSDAENERKGLEVENQKRSIKVKKVSGQILDESMRKRSGRSGQRSGNSSKLPNNYDFSRRSSDDSANRPSLPSKAPISYPYNHQYNGNGKPKGPSSVAGSSIRYGNNNQISTIMRKDVRLIPVYKNDIDIRICGGNARGVFIREVNFVNYYKRGQSLQEGDKILAINNTPLYWEDVATHF